MNISGALTYLQRIYKLGIVAYPRVENNYIKEKPFQFFPHPPLFEFGKKFKPLEEETLKLNKKTALLYLNHRRILSPANIKTYHKIIDEYLDNQLRIKPEKEEELRKIFILLDEFLKENNLSVAEIIKYYTEIYFKNLEAKKTLFLLKAGEFFSLDFTISRLRKIRTFFLKDTKNDELEEQIKFKTAENLVDAINKFQKEILNKKIVKKVKR